MGEIKVKLSDNVEMLFRKIAMKRFGYQKGAMSKAAEEAISSWTKLEDGGELTKEDLWDELEGVLSHVKKTSVELQHEIGSYRAERNIRKIKKR